MKIAVLTLRLHSNYGGILQAYALMHILKQLGHDPYLVNNQYFKKRTPLSLYFIYIRNAIQKYLLGRKNIEIFQEKRYRNEYEIVCKNTRMFVEKNIYPLTDFICTERDWKKLQKRYEFDAYIVGSDQVWRPAYFKHVEYFFLSFLKSDTVKRIAYAASFGTQEWTFSEKQTSLCGRLLKKFDAVSVREESAINMCKQYFGVEAIQVLDPTMLLSKDDYKKLLPKEMKLRSDVELLVYLLDVNDLKNKVVSWMEQQMNTKGVWVNNPKSEDKKLSYEDRIAPPVENWLSGFLSARYVVTDSFHACVFSILFHIPFWVVGNSFRGLTRIQSLLALLGLEDRLLVGDNLMLTFIQDDIDWCYVDEQLQLLRSKSLLYLTNVLK